MSRSKPEDIQVVGSIMIRRRGAVSLMDSLNGIVVNAWQVSVVVQRFTGVVIQYITWAIAFKG